jgi:hypothetical protein
MNYEGRSGELQAGQTQSNPVKPSQTFRGGAVWPQIGFPAAKRAVGPIRPSLRAKAGQTKSNQIKPAGDYDYDHD